MPLPSYYGDERDDPPKETPTVASKPKIVVEPKNKPSSPPEELSEGEQIRIRRVMELLQQFPLNTGSVVREVKDLKHLARIRKELITSPGYHKRFNEVAGSTLPAPVQAGLQRTLHISGFDTDGSRYEIPIRALSIERDGKLVWVPSDDVYV